MYKAIPLLVMWGGVVGTCAAADVKPYAVTVTGDHSSAYKTYLSNVADEYELTNELHAETKRLLNSPSLIYKIDIPDHELRLAFGYFFLDSGQLKLCRVYLVPNAESALKDFVNAEIVRRKAYNGGIESQVVGTRTRKKVTSAGTTKTGARWHDWYFASEPGIVAVADSPMDGLDLSALAIMAASASASNKNDFYSVDMTVVPKEHRKSVFANVLKPLGSTCSSGMARIR